MRYFNYYVLFIASFFFISCGSNEFNWEEKYKNLSEDEKRFTLDFEELYGSPEEEGMTWMTAKNAKVNVDLSSLPRDCYSIKIYTDKPYEDNNRSFLVAEYNDIEELSKTLLFDYPIGLSSVFVTAISANGECYLVEFALVEGNEYNVSIIASDLFPLYYEQEAMRYNLCFEGYVGGSVDFDYNDIVVEIEYVLGRSEIPVSLRAVGTNCFTQLIYGNDEFSSTEVIFDEAHESLGFPSSYNFLTKKDEYLFLNTGLNDTDKSATFSLFLKEDTGRSICEIAPKFRMGLKDNKDDKETKYYSITTKKDRSFTQALLIAAPLWNYPPEGMWIHVPHIQFHYWVAYPSKFPLWYTNIWNEPLSPA